MSYTQLLALVAIGVLLASPAFPQSGPDTALRFTPRPVTITTAGGRSYVVGIQRSLPEPVEMPLPTPRKAPDKGSPRDKASP